MPLKPDQPSAAQSKSNAALAAVMIILLTLAAYTPALRAGFIWDDDSYVTGNMALRSANGLWRVWHEIGVVEQYYPLVHTGYWIEYHLWGLHPFSYHLVNVLLHALAAVLLGRVLVRLRVAGAWIGAAIFALHPVCVESVAWITERKNVLSAVFYFGAALAYLRFSEAPKASSRAWSRWRWYAGALVLYIAALLSKTVTCSLPVALLLGLWWKNKRLGWSQIIPLLPLFSAGAGLGLLTIWIERHHVGAIGPEWSLTFLQRCLLAGRVVCFYVSKLLWPASLTFVYPHWNVQPNLWWQWLFSIVVIGALITLWLARRRLGNGPLVAALFFVTTLGPALGFLDVFPMRYSYVADHFQYLASVGLIALAAAALSRLPRPVWALLVLCLGFLTWRQCLIYHDVETLWRDTLTKNPDCWLAQNNLGTELEDRGQFDQAFEHFNEARRIHPDYAETYNNLGNVYTARRQFDAAIENYREAVRLDPKFVVAMNSLGALLAMQGKVDEGVAILQQAERLKPDDARTRINLGNALEQRRDLYGAIEQYAKAIEIAPNDPVAHKNLGFVLAETGRLAEATSHYEESLRLDPADAGAHYLQARALAQLGRANEAISHLKEALRLNPDYAEAKLLLRELDKTTP